LKAAAKAKEAAVKVSAAKMDGLGQSVVKRAESTVQHAALSVQVAQAAENKYNMQKAKADKAVLDAAGGKYAGAAGYAGQGGYFGAALRTAFKNGELTEAMKHKNWKGSTLKNDEKAAFKAGQAKGLKTGAKAGMKAGEEAELPMAMAKAKKSLKIKKADKAVAKLQAVKAADKSTLDAEAKNEAAKVNKQVSKLAGTSNSAAKSSPLSKTEIDKLAASAVKKADKKATSKAESMVLVSTDLTDEQDDNEEEGEGEEQVAEEDKDDDEESAVDHMQADED